MHDFPPFVMQANTSQAGDQFYRTEFQNIWRKEQWQIEALAVKVTVAFGVNLCDVTQVGVLDQQEGEDLWPTAAESGAVVSWKQAAG
jgi:hypothetical protein